MEPEGQIGREDKRGRGQRCKKARQRSRGHRDKGRGRGRRKKAEQGAGGQMGKWQGDRRAGKGGGVCDRMSLLAIRILAKVPRPPGEREPDYE